MKKSEIIFGLLRIPIDFSMVICAFWLAYTIRLKSDLIPGVQLELDTALLPNGQEYIKLSIFFAGSLLAIYALFGLYQLKNQDGPLKEIRRVCSYTSVWLLLLMAFFFATRELFFSRLVLAYGAIFSLVFITSARSILNLI